MCGRILACWLVVSEHFAGSYISQMHPVDLLLLHCKVAFDVYAGQILDSSWFRMFFCYQYSRRPIPL